MRRARPVSGRRIHAVLSNDGILTVTLHPSDANVSYNFAAYLEPRVEAD